MDQRKFSSAKNEKIRNINQEYVNKKVRILGTALPSDENNIFTLDDGTHQINVQTDNQFRNTRQLVRVAGRVILNKNQVLEIKADYVQNMGNLNKVLYSKVQDIKQKLKL